MEDTNARPGLGMGIKKISLLWQNVQNRKFGNSRLLGGVSYYLSLSQQCLLTRHLGIDRDE